MHATLKRIAERAASSLETLQSSYDLARLAIQNGVPGDFVECGVFQGAQCAAMALAIQQADNCASGVSWNRPRVHLFDSFSGVPAAGPHDRQWREAGHPEGQSAASLADVQSNMREWGIDPALLVYYPGLFEETIPRFAFPIVAARPKIAILRLDGDLYESTKVCIEHLYPLVSPGGWIIVDDYGLDGARKAVNEFWERTSGYPLVMWQKQ